MNILILSCGTRNKIIQYFKKTLDGKGKVVATDMSAAAPAIYEADQYYLVPRITAPGYIDLILDICKKEKIDGVLSLIDPELALLAENKARFAEVGTTVIGSDYALCELAMDKMKMFRWLQAHGYPCARSFDDPQVFFAEADQGNIDYPVFVKPIRGSASMAISKVYDRQTVEFLFRHHEGLMIQEFLDGQEIGADCYIDMVSGALVSVFTKKKLVMRAGETDKGLSFKDPELFALIERFVAECGWRGVIDIDVFDINGTYYVSEVNPRFGGGYPHAYECGCDFMSRIGANLSGKATEPMIGDYEEDVLMMKYNEIMLKKGFSK